MSCCRRALKGFVRDEPGFSTDPRSPGAASLVGESCRPGACHVVRPLHEATGNAENLEPQRHCHPNAELLLSVRYHRLEHGSLAGPPARIRASALGSSASGLPDRLAVAVGTERIDHELALKLAATRTRLTTLRISPHCARHSGASTAAFKMLLDLQAFKQEDNGSVRTPCDATKKLANDLGIARCLRREHCCLVLMDSSFRKLYLAAVVDIRALRRKLLLNVFNERKVWFPPARSVSHDCMGWQGLEVASTQPCQCPLSIFCLMSSAGSVADFCFSRSDRITLSRLNLLELTCACNPKMMWS